MKIQGRVERDTRSGCGESKDDIDESLRTRYGTLGKSCLPPSILVLVGLMSAITSRSMVAF